MAMAQRRKWMILALALYWPALFVLAHIPIPQVVREANMSDKGLHFLVYAILTFLLWSAVGPDSKVKWRRPGGWLILAAVLLYSLCDEGLQHFVSGRSADAKDLVADLAGAAVALGILTVFSFWPAGAIVTAITVYMLPVLARRNLMNLLPVMTTVFYVGGYATFTLLWTRCLRWPKGARRVGWAWLAASVSGPLALLAVTRISAKAAGRPFDRWDMLAAAMGILAGVLVAWTVGWLAGRKTRRANGDSPLQIGSERPVERVADEHQLPGVEGVGAVEGLDQTAAVKQL
jgi:VanZ family protein